MRLSASQTPWQLKYISVHHYIHHLILAFNNHINKQWGTKEHLKNARRPWLRKRSQFSWKWRKQKWLRHKESRWWNSIWNSSWRLSNRLPISLSTLLSLMKRKAKLLPSNYDFFLWKWSIFSLFFFSIFSSIHARNNALIAMITYTSCTISSQNVVLSMKCSWKLVLQTSILLKSFFLIISTSRYLI